MSTTFPFFVSKLVEAHNELRETSVLSQFKRNLQVPPYSSSTYGVHSSAAGLQYGAAGEAN